MGKTLRIHELSIKDHRGWQEAYNLNGRLIGITGPIDRGKTSMVDCIGFVLGRTTHFRGAVQDRLAAVRVRLQIGNVVYQLERSRKSPSRVKISGPGGDPLGAFAVKPVADEQSLSSWLLERLELDDAFASVRPSGNKTLGFATDLLPYLHIRQEDIDRFIVRPHSGADDANRIAVAKMLLRLTSPEYERLSASVHDKNNVIDRRTDKIKELRTFLQESDVTSQEALAKDTERLRTEEAAARRKLESLQADARNATGFADEARQKLRKLKLQLTNAENEFANVEQLHRDSVAKIEAMDNSVSALGAALAEPEQLAAIKLHLTKCCACGCDLTHRVVPAGHCGVCTEPLPDTARSSERARLLQARQAAVGARDKHARDRDTAKRNVERCRREHDEAARRLDERTADGIAPHVDALTAAAAELSSILTEMDALKRAQEPHARLATREEEVEELRDEVATLEHARSQAAAELVVDPAEVLDRLDSLFLQIVAAFHLPWASGRARVDRSTLVPVVDEQDFAQRGGGSRTAVSVAYSLALLLCALEDPRVELPTFLILDSPQKNLGHNPHDQDLAERMYRWLTDYLSLRHEVIGARYGEFQLIVVDNDIPSSVRSDFDVIVQFAGEQGFIRDLDFPHGEPDRPRQLEFGDIEDES
ncbi:hypothetical protein [Saccharopolyspora gloriosae]|uniref:hypothetical protein n=1 Tax=Saccharopolyspora gloriosae TaxID=455344 RepID=UPI001FB63F9E|nr:hypothetical protein [Saccharopolyspora gloriosae]